jgi:O-antigen/teichoic acid export membrane protein
VKNVHRTVATNVTANLVRGGATAAVAVLLPHFLTHGLDRDRFAAWSLMLQIAAYVGYLDFGLQTAVARFVAQASELEQLRRREQLIGTARTLLIGAALLGTVVTGTVILNLQHLFKGIPPELIRELSIAAAIVSLGSCLLLPFSTYTGILIGLHNNGYTAIGIGGSRLLGALVVIVACRYTHSLVVLGLCLVLPNLMGGIFQWLVARNLILLGNEGLLYWDAEIAREIARYCSGLTVYAFGMLLVGGLDVSILGYFRFSEVGFYSVAGILVSFFAGLNMSLMSATIAPLAALHARNAVTSIGQLVMRITKLNVFANFVMVALVFLAGHKLLTIWVGSVYATRALPILELLAVAQALRLVVAAYSAMLIATGQQNKGIESVLAEGCTNLIASIIGGALFGGIGVAWGTLIGAVVGALVTLFYTMPRAKEVPFRFRQFLSTGVLPAVASAAPIFLLLAVPQPLLGARLGLSLVLSALSLAAAVWLNVMPIGGFRRMLS